MLSGIKTTRDENNQTCRIRKNVIISQFFLIELNEAGVVKLADTPDLGSGAAKHGGSSPSTRTNCCLNMSYA